MNNKLQKSSHIGMGKGAFYLTISGLIFSLSGYIVHIGLGRYLGPERYGIFGIVISNLTILTLMLSTGIPRATSKFISEEKYNNIKIMNFSIKIQIIFSIIIFCIYILIVHILSNILKDNSLSFYFYISAFVIPFYALNSLYKRGYLNGYKQFKKQAVADIIFSISKVFIIFLLVFLGYGIYGAIIGYILAALIGFIVGLIYIKKINVVKNFDKDHILLSKKLIIFAIPVIIYSISLFLIFNIDLLSVKAILQNNIDAGLYTSATNIARIPYFSFGGLALAILPSISYTYSKNNFLQTQNYIIKSIRYLLMILVPGILVIFSTSRSLILFLYGERYVNASEPLQILIIGLGLLAIFNVLSHIIMANGKPFIISFIAIIIVILSLFFNAYLIPIYGLKGAAFTTTIVSAIGLFIISLYVYQKNKVLINPKSFIRIIFSSAIIFGISYTIKFEGIFLIIEYSFLIIIYLFLLIIIKEIKRDDLITIKKIILPRKIL